MKSKPNVIRIGQGIYRLDLRSKAFDGVRGTVANGRKSLEFEKRVDAEKKAHEIEALLAQYGAKRMETFDHLFRADPVKMAERLIPWGKTIADAVEFYVAHLTEQDSKNNSATLGTLVDEWLVEKKKRVEQGTLRKRTYATLMSRGGFYKEKWGARPVATITKKEIEEWIEGWRVQLGENTYSEASQQTKYHLWSYLSQFFIWCRKKHGVPVLNPCESIAIHRDEKEPEYFTPEQATDLLELTLSERFLPLVPLHTICLFAGIRPQECERLNWECIDFEDSAIVMKKSHAKTRKNRRVEMQPNLVAWLQWFRKTFPDSPLIPPALDYKRRQFQKNFPHRLYNGMRHSYATYILGARLGDFGYLEQHMGNSRTMLQNHYVNYPSKETSERFWCLYPPQGESKEVGLKQVIQL